MTTDDDRLIPHSLRVVAKTKHFRRAGREFTREAVDIPLETLTEAEIDALLAEPMLEVAYIAIGHTTENPEDNTDEDTPPALESPQPVPPSQEAAPATSTDSAEGDGAEPTDADTGAGTVADPAGSTALVEPKAGGDDVQSPVKPAAKRTAKPKQEAEK